MKQAFWVTLVILVLLAGIYAFHRPAKSVNSAPIPGSTSNSAQSPAANAPPNSTASSSPVLPSGISPAPDLSARAGAMVPVVADTNAPQTPSAILESMRRVIRSYNTEYGENPVGNNADITATLMGNNPRHINFIQPDTGLRVNRSSELIDAWGTPFFFHQLSAQDMEIHSAGPDHTMWTSDDLVTH